MRDKGSSGGRWRRPFWIALLLGAAFGITNARAAEMAKQQRWLPATPQKLPRWRGFNLLEKFYFRGARTPFLEEDFRLISGLGFNFVRLPMDYRCWIKDGNWEQFDEETLKEIDQAVGWGARYGIHVSINFHRAPGYTVARPAESKSLWTDADAQRVCALHWAAFARRYKGIPNERLSFNLMNEPAGVDAKVYVEVVRRLAEAIRAEDPERLIISDGLQWGQNPIPELRALRIAQATRGYTPMELTHYKASWVNGEGFPMPTWPRLAVYGTLYGSSKKEFQAPLVLEGPFARESQMRLHVMVVSQGGTLVAEADAKQIWEHKFLCGPGEGEWKKAEFKAQYDIYQNLYDRDYTFTVPAGAKEVRLSLTDGDWLQVTEVGIKAGEKEDVLSLINPWGRKPVAVKYAPGAAGGAFQAGAAEDREWLWQRCVQPWKDAEATGIGVMVGEWGAFNSTPHDVTLRWMEDCLRNWQKAGFGWALWNFRGSFGVLDSGRKDVQYEEFEGHKLDRKMLDLLQRY